MGCKSEKVEINIPTKANCILARDRVCVQRGVFAVASKQSLSNRAPFVPARVDLRPRWAPGHLIVEGVVARVCACHTHIADATITSTILGQAVGTLASACAVNITTGQRVRSTVVT